MSNQINLENFNIFEANQSELKFYAFEKHGLQLAMTMSEETMRQKIIDYCITNDLPVPKESDFAHEVGAADAVKQVFGEALINIPSSEKPGGKEPVFVGFQGKGYTVPRNVDVWVPIPLVNILRDAISDYITQDEDGTLNHNEALTYPFSVLERREPKKKTDAAA